MKRPLLVILLAAVVGLGGIVAWTAVSRDREYRRLIAAGDAALAGDQAFQAIEAFSGAIALNHDSMLAYLRRGETYRRLGDLKAALRDLRRASELDPTATRPLERLGDVLAAQERHARAAERYEAYVRIDDRSPRVLYKLGLARFQAGEAKAAVPALRQAVRLDDRFSEAWYLLGLCLQDQRQTNDAAFAFQRAAQVAPGFAEPREALAALYRRQNRATERIDQLEALVALDPGRIDRQLALGLAHADAGRPDLAVITLGRAAERHPDNMAIYTALAAVWLQQAEVHDDHAALAKALEATATIVSHGVPTSQDLLLRGRALAASGDLEGAVRVLRDAAVRIPVAPPAFEQLANCTARLGNFAEAREAFGRYLAFLNDDRKEAETLAKMADLSVRLREHADAVRWQTAAVEHAPHDQALQERLEELRAEKQ